MTIESSNDAFFRGLAAKAEDSRSLSKSQRDWKRDRDTSKTRNEIPYVGGRLGQVALALAAGVGSLQRPSTVSDRGFYVRCLRVVETGVEASDDGECSGEPQDTCESLELSIVRIGLQTTE